MKQKFLLKAMLLLFALIAGSSSVWADNDPNWTGTVLNTTSGLNTTGKTYTFTVSEVDYVWNYDGTVAAGTPTVTLGTANSTQAIKFGSSGSNYFNPVILSTDAFSDKAVTKVRLYLKHNGSKAGSLTVKQGSITIGTATTESTSNWINVVCSETKKGAGGTLEIKYEVAQALYINKIEVWYEDLGTATTTTIDDSGITNTDVYLGTAAGSLSASVTEKVSGDAVVGATVTWSSSNEDVAVVSSEGVITLKKKGTTTITASYDGDATYAASSADYVLNVTSSAPQKTTIDVATNYEWLGVTSGKSISADDLPKDIDCEGVTVTIGTGGGTKPRGDNTYIRMYAGNSFKFTAPANYLIKEINFTKANDKWENTFNVDAGTWNNTDLKWTGLAQEVTLTEAGSSGNNQFSQMEIKLVASKTITISTYEWATYVTPCALDFTGLGVKAYAVEGRNGSSLILSSALTAVPEDTPLLLNAPEGSYSVPVAASADPVGTNFLKAGLGAVVTPTGGKIRYVLGVYDEKATFLLIDGTNPATVPLGKAYLEFSDGGSAPMLSLDGNTTGISTLNVERETLNDNSYYMLDGRRVAQPTKGLYIVNGKKVIIK